MRIFILFLLFTNFFTCSNAFGQDYIKLTSGEVFYGYIKEVTPSEIYYLSILPDDTTLYTIDKKNISFVKYKMRIKEVMNGEKVNSRKVTIPYKHKYQIVPMEGGDYMIEGRRGEEKQLRAIMLDKNDPELTKLVKKFTNEKRMGAVITYSTIPIAVTSLMLLFANHAVGFGNSDPAVDHLVYVLSGAEVLLFSGSIYLKLKKKKHIKEALLVYNKLVK